jgi:hypothetical protein
MVGKEYVAPLVDSATEALTGEKSLGSAIYSGVDKLQGLGLLPGVTDKEKQQAAERAAWKSNYESKLQAQGFVTRKQADLYKSNGVRVDPAKIREEGATVGMAKSASVASGGTPYNFEAYARTIGKRESNNNYSAVNQIGYVGKYQFGAAALEDMGLVKPGTAKKGNRALNDPSNWTIPGGLQAFLGNQKLQEDTFKRFTDLQYRRLIKAGVIGPESSSEDVAGYLAAAHLLGVGGAINLKKGKVGTDANGTSATSYFKLGSASQGGVNTAAVASPPFAAPSGTTSSASPSAVMATVSSAPVSATAGSQPGQASTQVAAAKLDPEATVELKKQTSLLSQLVSNTSASGRVAARPDSYMQDSATVMTGVSS